MAKQKEEDPILKSYLEGGEVAQGPSQEEKLARTKRRYEEIKAKWLWYFLQKWEAEGTSSEKETGLVALELEKNFQERAWVIRELQALGMEVTDPFASLLEVADEASKNAYAEGLSAGPEAAKEQDYLDYCRLRYDQIVKSYKDLILCKSEAKSLKRFDVLESTDTKLRSNFKQRVFVVRAMRKQNVKVEDPFVPHLECV